MDGGLATRIAELDSALPELAKPIRVLKYLDWPDEQEEVFLESWRAGRPALPRVELQIPDWTAEIAALEDFTRRSAGDHPVLQYLRRTTRSYAEAGRMLMAAGTPGFTEWSARLYGRPDDIYPGQSFTGVEAAAFLLEKTQRLFAGRMAFGDAILLGPCFESGFLVRPHYVPPWAEDTRRLAASLTYSSFMMNVELGAISVQNYVAAVERADTE